MTRSAASTCRRAGPRHAGAADGPDRDRELVATALDRGAARETYEEAIDRGKTTVLHEEVLRDVHQLCVGHVPPGAELAVRSTCDRRSEEFSLLL